MQRLIIIAVQGLFLMVLTSASLCAAETNRWGLSALFEAEWAYGVTKGEQQKLEVKIEPELEVDLGPDTRLTAIARLRTDGFDRLAPGTPSQSAIDPASRRVLVGDNVDFELREFYLQTKFAGSYLTIGKQQIVWGKADGLKVLDVVNPQDFREFILDEFDDSRIPLWSINAEIPIGPTTLDLLWIPDRSYHQIPEPDATFAFTAASLVPTAPPGVAVDLKDADRPRRFLADSDLGARLTAFWKGWDLSLNYLYHYHDLPILFQRLDMTPTGPRVTVTPRYERTHLIGGTFSNAFGDLTVRGEVGYSTDRFFLTRAPGDTDGVDRSSEVAYVLGLDWFGIGDTLISFQLFQSWLPGAPSGIIRNELDTTTTLTVRRDFINETLQAEIMWLQNFNDGDGLVRPKISYDLRENISVWAGADIFYGDKNGLFGEFDDNDRLVMGIECGW